MIDEKLIRAVIKIIKRPKRITYDELLSEGYVIYIQIPGDKPLSYKWSCLKNGLIKYIRKQLRNSMTLSDVAAIEQAEKIDITHYLVGSELKVVQNHMTGLTIEQIALKLGWSESSVQRELNNAYERIRRES